MRTVGIIILNFNSDSLTDSCLESLKTLQGMNQTFSINVYVVDNHSAHPYTNSKKYPFDLQIIKNDKNLGFSGGNNVGMKLAVDQGCHYILLLNNDTRVDKGLIQELLKGIEVRGGLASPKIYFEKGCEFHKKRYLQKDLGHVLWYAGGVMNWKNVIGYHRGVDEVDTGQYDHLTATELATGCCMLIDNLVIKKIGLLDEKYFLYYEDSDYSLRAKKAGFQISYVPAAFMWHQNAGSSGGSGSDLQDYFITRNRLIFGMKYAPYRARLALIKEALGIMLDGRVWQKKGVRDYFLFNFNKGSYDKKD